MYPYNNPANKSVGLSVEDSEILNFLEQRRCGVLATTRRDGSPHASVIYYDIDEYFVIRFLTKQKTQKSDNLSFNAQVVLVVFDERSQTTVQVEGVVERIPQNNNAETNEIFRNTLKSSLHTSGMGVPPVAKLAAGDYVAYRLIPERILMSSYTNRSQHIHHKIELGA